MKENLCLTCIETQIIKKKKRIGNWTSEKGISKAQFLLAFRIKKAHFITFTKLTGYRMDLQEDFWDMIKDP